MLSFIICSINDARFQAVSTNIASVLGTSPFEIIRIPDARSLSEGYNRGIAAAKGTHFVFCHDDIEILAPDFPARLARHFSRFDVIGVAGTSRLTCGAWITAGPPHIFGQVAHFRPQEKCFDICMYGVNGRAKANIHAVDGLFIAATRAAAEQIKFDAVTFDHFHLYDLDFSFRAHLAGLKVAVANDLPLVHASGGSYDQRWQIYKQRFEEKHRGNLQTSPPTQFQMCVVRVLNKPAALAAMDAPWFDE